MMLEMRKGGRDEESSVLLVGGDEVDRGLCGRPGAWPGVVWAAVVEVGVGGVGRRARRAGPTATTLGDEMVDGFRGSLIRRGMIGFRCLLAWKG